MQTFCSIILGWWFSSKINYKRHVYYSDGINEDIVLDTMLHTDGAKRPLVVLTHGLGGNAHCYGIVYTVYCLYYVNDFNVVVYNRRGHAYKHKYRTTRIPQHSEVEDYKAMIEHVTTEFCNGAPVDAAIAVSASGIELLKYMGIYSDQAASLIKSAYIISSSPEPSATAMKQLATSCKMISYIYASCMLQGNYVSQQMYAKFKFSDLITVDDYLAKKYHGYADVHEYYDAVSATKELPRIKVKTNMFLSFDDPFIDIDNFNLCRDAGNPNIKCHIELYGGHTGAHMIETVTERIFTDIVSERTL